MHRFDTVLLEGSAALSLHWAMGYLTSAPEEPVDGRSTERSLHYQSASLD